MHTPSSHPDTTARATELATELATAPVTAKPSRTLIAGVVAFIAVSGAACAAALNQLHARPPADAVTAQVTSVTPEAAPAMAASGAEQPNPEVMVARLAERLKKQPKDLEGWRMLARAYAVMERPDEALDANRHVVALAPDDADAMVELARSIGYANGRQLNTEAEALMNKALHKDPGNVLAHALLGKTELDRGQPAKAKVHWQEALAHLDAKHPFAEQLRQAIQAADQREADIAAFQQANRQTPSTSPSTPPAAPPATPAKPTEPAHP